MATISKEQLQQILTEAPKGTTPQGIIKGLQDRGHTIEGVAKEPVFTVRKAASVLDRIFGGGTIGDAIGTQIAKFRATPAERPFIDKGPSAKKIAADVAVSGAGALGFKGVGMAGGFLRRVLASAGLGATIGGGQAIKEDRSAVEGATTGAAIAGAVPVALKGTDLAFQFMAGASKRLASGIIGKGGDVVEQIAKNPTTALRAMKQAGIDETELIKELSLSTRAAVKRLQGDASKLYAQRLSELPQTKLPLDGVKQDIVSTLQKFGVQASKKGPDFGATAFTDQEEKVLRRLITLVDGWPDTTPVGINKLAIRVGKLRRSGLESKELNAVVDAAKKSIRNFIGKEIPETRLLNEEYGATQNLLGALRKELSIKNQPTDISGIIATSKRIGTMFNTNKELARELIKRLEAETGEDVLTREAARQASDVGSRSVESIGDVARVAIQTVIPPKLVAKLVARTSQLKQGLEPLADIVQQLTPASRTVLIKILEDMTNDEK